MKKTHSVMLLLVIFIGIVAAYTDNCHEHCIHCSATDGTTCKLCRHNLYLHNGTCIEACPNGYKETVQNVII